MTDFRHPEVVALVLAAGQGTRMKSDRAKVLHEVAGRPLLGHVLETLTHLGVGRVLVVVGHQREKVQEAFREAGVEWVVQAQQRGTGHAVLMAGPALEDYQGTLLVVCGDTPLLRAPTLDALLRGHGASGAAVTVLSMRLPDPKGYGRMLRGEGDALEGIVEERDATPEQRGIDEVNSGIYAFDYPALVTALSRLTAHNAQGEYYLTDTVSLLRRTGQKAAVVCAQDYRELLGVNTIEQLEEASRIFAEVRAGRGLDAAGGSGVSPGGAS
jgi:bifunctional UDP-N-acetylglucosamine pyrophosphorylase / glucosamine-1-phosphate N-acetyltransferase